MKNIFKRLIDATKDKPNDFHIGRATGLFQHKGSLDSPDKDETAPRRKHQIIFGQSRNLTRRPPIVVVILKDNDDEQ